MGQIIRSAMVSIDHASRVAEVRRLAATLAAEEHLEDAGKAAIVATELATNILKHATKGEMLVSTLSSRGQAGIEILAFDRGPGIANVSDALNDGHSTAGTPGTGLGAVRRLSDEFDVASEPGKGTVLMSRIFAGGQSSTDPPFVVGVTERPIAGETESGDNWGIRMSRDLVLVMMADGLGHGPLAAQASTAAVTAFQRSTEWGPAPLIELIHGALRSTRGAAVAVALLDFGKGQVRYAGLGNIAGLLLTAEKSAAMVSHNGIAGHEARRIREFDYPLAANSLLIMHSDGLSANSTAARSAGLVRRHPALISGILYQEAGRDRDDACVIVGRRRSSSPS